LTLLYFSNSIFSDTAFILLLRFSFLLAYTPYFEKE
jgi:hypothetical protein